MALKKWQKITWFSLCGVVVVGAIASITYIYYNKDPLTNSIVQGEKYGNPRFASEIPSKKSLTTGENEEKKEK
ncbi:hypothetical protein [Ureaplasma canigenitalium]|uniref:hypothetical protein n=1 Tax=Ureaplasma canigenitalium TaxID=42092 RepID=UPI0004E1209A|nr:hypothetical protein [Ureaplasma canigenitalium]